MLDRADEPALFLALQPGQGGVPRRQEETPVPAVLEDAVERFLRGAGAEAPRQPVL